MRRCDKRRVENTLGPHADEKRRRERETGKKCEKRKKMRKQRKIMRGG
jgi:hypothetical protein